MALSYKNDEDKDERLNPASQSARDLYSQETDTHPGYDNLDDRPAPSQDNSGKSEDKNDPSKNIDATKEQEEQAGGWSNKFSGNNQRSTDKANFLKKKGPLAGILLTIFAGGFGIAGLLSPSLLLVQMKEMFTKFGDDSTPALSVRTQKLFAKKVAGVKNSFEFSKDGSCNVKCKFGTMSDTMKRNLEAKGYKVLVEPSNVKFGGRSVVSGIVLPGEKTPITTGEGWTSAMKDPARASEFRGVFNSKTAYFLNSRFGTMLKVKFGLDKLPKLATGAKEKVQESFRKALNLPESSPSSTPRETISADKKIQVEKISAKISDIAGGKASNVLGVICLGYNVSRAVTITAKLAKIAAYTSFAMIFLNAADELKAGNLDPSIMTALGDQLTATDSNKTNPDGSLNPNYGLSATDSAGYKMAAYNDNPGSSASPYSLATSAGAVGVLASINGFVGKNSAARTVAHDTCKTIGSPLAVLAQCAPEIGAGLLAAGVGAIPAAILCIGGNVAAGAILSKGIGLLVPTIVAALASGDIISLDQLTQGVDAGNALFTGSTQILGGKSQASGLAPASSQADIQGYSVAVQQLNQQDTAIAQYDARKTPFDIYNQYSFLGSMAHTAGIASLSTASPVSILSSIGSMIPRSFSALTLPASAASIQDKSNLYNNPNCPDLAAINVVGDAMCNPTYVMSGSELNMSDTAAIDTLVSSKNIDVQTGDAIPGSDYEKYQKYCGINRTEPLGETSGSIEDDDYEWQIGAKCNEQSPILSAMRVYTMDETINTTMNGDQATGNTTVTSGDSQSLAKQILASPNVQFQTPAERPLFQTIADTGKQTLINGPSPIDGSPIQGCDGTTQVPISSKLLSVILAASQKFKITIGVVASGHDCDTAYHPKGQALDINGVAHLDQPFVQKYDWSGGQVTMASEFYTFLDTTSSQVGTSLELGQKQCFGNSLPQLTNSKLVTDDCSHIHIGVVNP
jgi:hypothetical protein